MGTRHDWLGKGIEALMATWSAPRRTRPPELPPPPPATQEPDFDVLIVGSGYGGAIAASRFARAHDEHGRKLKIAVLERGQEYRPGDFPSRFSDVPGEVRFMRSGKSAVTGEALGMFDFHINGKINVLTGNGLGGGSLINAGVAERVHDEVWNAPEWPKPLRKGKSTFSRYYLRAESMLRVATMPVKLWPAKTRQMQKLGGAIDAATGEEGSAPSFRPVNAAINYEHRKNAYGIEQQACQRCGDCFTGCNFNAKNTLATNYLPDARRFGAQLYTGATVSFVEQLQSGGKSRWRLWFRLTDTLGAPGRQDAYWITARHVVLAAGALGSTEILFRSQQHGLKLSPRLGRRFSTNGDMIWAGYDQAKPVHSGSDEFVPYEKREVGPTITSMIDLRHTPVRGVVQDAAVPGSLFRAYAELITTGALFYRMTDFTCKSEGKPGGPDPDAVDPDKIERTAVYLTMGRSEKTGHIEYSNGPQRNDGERGSIDIVWKDAGKDDLYDRTESSLQAGLAAQGGTLIANPLWRTVPTALQQALSGPTPPGSLLTVHPLGGCAMGDSFDEGVVNHYGAVFDGMDATSVHEGLYVFDGAAVPTALGINPLLTISALAERSAEIVANCNNWHIDYAAPPPPDTAAETAIDLMPVAVPHEPVVTELSFTEVMKGKLTGKGASGDWPQARRSAQLAVDFLFDVKLAPFLRNRKRRLAIDSARLQWGVGKNAVKIELKGTVDWLTEAPRPSIVKLLLGAYAYARIRLLPDLASLCRNREIGEKEQAYDPVGLLKLASHVGTKRLLVYRLEPKDPKQNWELIGTKTVHYVPGGNVWRSLSNLETEIRDKSTGRRLAHGVVKLDWRNMFNHRSFQIRACENDPYAWLDLASMGALFLRCVARIHFWSFRKPDYVAAKRTFPLPGPLPGTEGPHWHIVDVPTHTRHGNRPVQIGLSRYCPTAKAKAAPNPDCPPVMVIHGFGASGLQFAAPQLDENIVQHLVGKGRDVWVLELRTSIAMPTSHDQWPLDDVAREDIPAAVKFILEAYRDKQSGNRPYEKIDLLAHCIGSAMFNIAVLSGGLDNQKQSLIRSAVMLQVGPIFVVSQNNYLRAAAANFLGVGTNIDYVDSTVDEHSANWHEVLVDRALATYPLPKKQAALLQPRFPWQVRTDIADFLRSAGVFGRLFQQENVDDRVRNALGDLLGRTNLATYKQVLHCVDNERLVDQFGRPVYVTDANIARYYKFSARFVYGALNNVFGKAGVVQSVKRLRQVFPEGRFDHETIPGYGHLDALVGHRASKDVYPAISCFLQEPAPDTADSRKPGNEDLSLMRALVGPIVGWTRMESVERYGSTAERPVLRIWLKANETRRPAVSVECVLLDEKKQCVDDSYRSYKLIDIPYFNFAVCDVVLPDAQKPYTVLLRTFHRGFDRGFVEPGALSSSYLVPDSPIRAQFDVERRLDGGLDIGAATRAGTAPADAADPPMPEAAERAQQRDQAPHSAHDSLPGADAILRALDDIDPMGSPTGELSKISDNPGQALCDAAMKEDPRGRDSPHQGVLVPPGLLAATAAPGPQEAFTFATASCRYTGSPIEVRQGDKAFNMLEKWIDDPKTPPEWRPAFTIAIGDQIYADSTSNVFELRTRLETYSKDYENSFNADATRKVYRRLPNYFMLDDHEIVNDWEPDDDAHSPANAERTRIALATFYCYQWSHGPRNSSANGRDPRKLWYSFRAGGHDFFVLDTRMQRSRRPDPGTDPSHGRIVGEAQMQALRHWLRQCRDESGNKPKFVFSPSAIAPIPSDQCGNKNYHARSDGWHAYPQSMRELTDIVIDDGIQNLVMISGDLHSNYACTMHLSKNGKAADAVALVSSPLYAPYPFANTDAGDYDRNYPAASAGGDAGYGFGYDMEWPEKSDPPFDPYQGHLLLQVRPDGSGWQLSLAKVRHERPTEAIVPVWTHKLA